MTDHLGSVRDLVNANGTVIDHIDYDSYGNIVQETIPLAGDRFKFTGQQFEVVTGLYYDLGRYYNSQTGSFISQDPMGFSGGDTNLYRYVDNSPTDFTDPTGLLTAEYVALLRLIPVAVVSIVEYAWYKCNAPTLKRIGDQLGNAIGAAITYVHQQAANVLAAGDAPPALPLTDRPGFAAPRR